MSAHRKGECRLIFLPGYFLTYCEQLNMPAETIAETLSRDFARANRETVTLVFNRVPESCLQERAEALAAYLGEKQTQEVTV